jgi:molybdate-binding protein
MVTVVGSLTLDDKTVNVLQAWVREVGLHSPGGRPISVRKACELIVEDFALTLVREDEEVLLQ